MEWRRFITTWTADGWKLSPVRVCLTVTFIVALSFTIFYGSVAGYIFFSEDNGAYLGFLFKNVLTVELLTLLWSSFGVLLAKAAQDSHIQSKNGHGQTKAGGAQGQPPAEDLKIQEGF